MIASSGLSYTGHQICQSPSDCIEPVIKRASHLADVGRTMAQEVT
jgi:hypothetical protein